MLGSEDPDSGYTMRSIQVAQPPRSLYDSPSDSGCGAHPEPFHTRTGLVPQAPKLAAGSTSIRECARSYLTCRRMWDKTLSSM